jgi:hypothetical protein
LYRDVEGNAASVASTSNDINLADFFVYEDVEVMMRDADAGDMSFEGNDEGDGVEGDEDEYEEAGEEEKRAGARKRMSTFSRLLRAASGGLWRGESMAHYQKEKC